MGTKTRAGSGSITSATLLLRVRDVSDAKAWRDLVDRYTPRIYAWARAKGLQDADAADVTSIVLMRLVEAMRTFEYDPARSFRGWLKTVTNHAIGAVVNECRRLARRARDGGPETVFEAIADPRNQEDLQAALDRAHDENLRCEAEERVRLRVKRRMWQVYLQSCIENQPAPLVAQSLGFPVTTVYQYKRRVIKMLAEEIQRLQRSGR